jgi:hypothetical protein
MVPQALRYWYSLTSLMHIVTQLRPTNWFQCRNYDAYLLSFAYPPIYACVSYLSAMVLLFLDLQGALYHSPLKLKITVNSIQSQKHLGLCLPTAGSQTWVRLG